MVFVKDYLGPFSAFIRLDNIESDRKQETGRERVEDEDTEQRTHGSRHVSHFVLPVELSG